MFGHITSHKTILLLIIAVLAVNLRAQDRYPEDSIYNEWDIRVGPYFWFIGMEGEIVKPPVPSQLPEATFESIKFDFLFKDIANSLKFALMLTGQYRNDHLVTQFNFSSFVIESEIITPLEYLLQDNIIRLTYIGGDFGIGYRLVKRKRLDLDLLVGGKFIYFDASLISTLAGRIPVGIYKNTLWFDPILAMNIKFRPHPRWELAGYADYGPRFIGGYHTYQSFTNLNFIISRHFMVSGGYRYYHVDSERDDVVYRGDIKGMLLRFCAQF